MKCKLASIVDREAILREVYTMKFWEDGSKALMSIRPSFKPEFLEALPGIQAALAEIEFLRDSNVEYVMVNRLPPGVEVPVHTDTLLHHEHRERWHLPIKTSDLAYWWDEEIDCRINLQGGYWHGPVHYWKKHSVGNLGLEERIHLVVDLMKRES